ncbi:ABC-type lipoprotein export system ATPase subunit [Rubricella aquisinus]|uniref:ABC-type lipoprotein export system ATPase subunit n=1 Tax=Rubricella aquisinus TaxID=2028108 RepID=A0A840WK99_9RHOB|nr:ABC transporter ATP-binding protein [Rubricella aquisinus]MBB5514951.1 ABC-type lipoprotein export system ATPase subunit [Rubricella aquisinus]
MTDRAMIEVTGLALRRGESFALAIEHLSIPAGERVAVVGPSGAGKTTLLNILSGILNPDAGHVRIGETAVTTLSDRQRRMFRARNIGFVFQDFELVEYLSARENILYPYRLTDALSITRDVRDRAEALAASVGLEGKLRRKPANLSQGEKQRVAICRALLPRPKLILADEATGNLDPANKDLILDILFEQAQAAGATLLAVTHDHALLPRFDRVINFDDFAAVPA